MSFLNEFGGLGIGLQQDFLALGLCLGQLSSYLFCVGKPLSDLTPSLFQHLEDRLIGEPIKNKADDGEADDLGNQMRPVHAEGIRKLLDLTRAIRFNQKSQSIHRRLSLKRALTFWDLRRNAPLT